MPTQTSTAEVKRHDCCNGSPIKDRPGVQDGWNPDGARSHMDDLALKLSERRTRWAYPKLEAAQAALSCRAPTIRSALERDGWRYIADIGAYECAGVRIYIQHGDPAIQRRLNLEEPYVSYTVKSVDTPAEVIRDDVTVDINVTISVVQSAVAKARAAIQ